MADSVNLDAGPNFTMPDLLPSGRTGWTFSLDDRNGVRRRYRELRRDGHSRTVAAVEVVEVANALRNMFPQPYDPCRWFALCENYATGSTPHPILGHVPTCDRCAELAAG